MQSSQSSASLPEAALVEPSEKLRAELLSLAIEFREDGDDRYIAELDDFSGYLKRTSGAGKHPPDGLVPWSEFWLVAGDRVAGRSKLRHHLNPDLEREGGHIGYSIRPSERRKGFGTLILKLTLERAGKRGLKRVLVTCDEDNIGSARIIEKNGGILTGRAISKRSGKPILQYWIDL